MLTPRTWDDPRVAVRTRGRYASVRSEAVREVVVGTMAELALAARLDAPFTTQALHLLLRALVDDAAAVRVQVRCCCGCECPPT